MTGENNIFPRFAFRLEQGGKVDAATKAFFSRFSGRSGPAISSLTAGAGWSEIAQAANAILKEFAAQGWVKRGFDADETALAQGIRAVTMIPAATEWAYSPREVLRSQITVDVHFVTTENGYSVRDPALWTLIYGDARKAGRFGAIESDWATSLDRLRTALPNCKLVNLFVSWYGNDLRCGECDIYPAVTRASFNEFPRSWEVADIKRYQARVVSKVDGNAAFGGTPDDQSVKDCIADLKARGHAVAVTPFLLMDIPAGNTLPDPHNGAIGQPIYPWRGRITKAFHTADKTSEVAAEVAAFVTKYDAYVLHYANLCAAAGGVNVFVIGTELRGLTWLRSSAGVYPFVNALKELAASVKAVLPNAKVTYAADWSEWFGHHPADGSGDVSFHLDPLWSDPNVDAVAFDNYWPLSDWREGTSHLDYSPSRSITDYDYLQSNIRGGEGYDWFYANASDRDSQTRTPITDGAYGKPWVFRFKDVWSWWSNEHHDRQAGIESGVPTAWVPQSKPIWFTELGVPSIDKATNQPNVFYDPKSSESSTPYYSTSVRDTLIQQRGLHTMLKYFDPADGGFTEAYNPESTVYPGRMVDLDHVMVYTWDARPYPFFPLLTEVWSDGPNYEFGHWIDGKVLSFPALGALDDMAVTATYAPRHPYIIDPATGTLDKQYKDFFEAIEFVQANAIANVPSSPTPTEAATAINAILTVLRAHKRIAS